MPSPLGEGQINTPINHLNLGEVPFRTIPAIEISDGFVILRKGDPSMPTVIAAGNSSEPDNDLVCSDGSPLQRPPAIGTESRTAEKNTGLVQPSVFALLVRRYFPVIR